MVSKFAVFTPATLPKINMKTSTKEEKVEFIIYGRDEIEELYEEFGAHLDAKANVIDAFKAYKVYAKERRNQTINEIFLDIVTTG